MYNNNIMWYSNRTAAVAVDAAAVVAATRPRAVSTRGE